MEESSKYVGGRSKPYVREITWRHAMNFAAGTDDPNPFYFNDEREGGIVVPPMLAVSLSWPLGERCYEFWTTEQFPLDLLIHQVHYLAHVEFHRLMHPGDIITVNGSIAAILPHRAGAILVIRFDGKNQNDEPVFTEFGGGIIRGVKLIDKGNGADNVPQIPKFHREGDPLWEHEIHVSPLAAHIYDGCADIHNPIHTSEKFARSVGLPGIILHGSCTLAWAVRDIVNRHADGDPRRLKRVGCRFTNMVLLDTNIKVQLLGLKDEDDATIAFFEVRNGDGKRAISDGFVRIAKS